MELLHLHHTVDRAVLHLRRHPLHPHHPTAGAAPPLLHLLLHPRHPTVDRVVLRLRRHLLHLLRPTVDRVVVRLPHLPPRHTAAERQLSRPFPRSRSPLSRLVLPVVHTVLLVAVAHTAVLALLAAWAASWVAWAATAAAAAGAPALVDLMAAALLRRHLLPLPLPLRVGTRHVLGLSSVDLCAMDKDMKAR